MIWTMTPDQQAERMAEAITREHYRRAEQRIEASPEEHGRAFADAAMAAIQAEPDQTATIKPGDTLILRYTRPIALDMADQIKAKVSALIPDIQVVIINCDQMAVYRPDSTAAPWPLDA